MKYQIKNGASGIVLGTWEAETPEAALEAMARDAGYQTYADAQDIAEGSLDVTEVKKEEE